MNILGAAKKKCDICDSDSKIKGLCRRCYTRNWMRKKYEIVEDRRKYAYRLRDVR